jgi:hypothetical protein
VARVTKARVVATALVAKGMTEDEGQHHRMYTKTVDGRIDLITRISHGSHEISRRLANAMAKQCALTLAEFWQLVDCPLDREQWDALVRQRCPDGRNPFINR